MNNSLTDVAGLKVGHWTDQTGGTGCTVILCGDGAVAGVDVRGGAPGTREMVLLAPTCMVQQIHAVMLSGGSAFGLAAADGVMTWLEERSIGFDVGVSKVPIVPTAILFDLAVGDPKSRPTAQAGYAACDAAADDPIDGPGDGSIAQGNVGAGTGASVGKMLGPSQATKGGLGTASIQAAGGIVVAALVAVNAIGHVIDPQTQQIIAGPRDPATNEFVDTVEILQSRAAQGTAGTNTTGANTAGANTTGTNTTIAVVATNVALDKAGCTKVAQMAHDGLARVIRPIHTSYDGDTIFVLSKGDKAADVNLVGALAADVLAEAVLAAVNAAESAYGLPAAREFG